MFCGAWTGGPRRSARILVSTWAGSIASPARTAAKKTTRALVTTSNVFKALGTSAVF